MSDSLWSHGLQHTSLPCPSLSPRVCSNSHPLSWWCRPTISSSITPFSTCLLSFPASKSFPMSWSFASGGQNIGASASASKSKFLIKKKKNPNSSLHLHTRPCRIWALPSSNCTPSPLLPGVPLAVFQGLKHSTLLLGWAINSYYSLGLAHTSPDLYQAGSPSIRLLLKCHLLSEPWGAFLCPGHFLHSNYHISNHLVSCLLMQSVLCPFNWKLYKGEKLRAWAISSQWIFFYHGRIPWTFCEAQKLTVLLEMWFIHMQQLGSKCRRHN